MRHNFNYVCFCIWCLIVLRFEVVYFPTRRTWSAICNCHICGLCLYIRARFEDESFSIWGEWCDSRSLTTVEIVGSYGESQRSRILAKDRRLRNHERGFWAENDKTYDLPVDRQIRSTENCDFQNLSFPYLDKDKSSSYFLDF